MNVLVISNIPEDPEYLKATDPATYRIDGGLVVSREFVEAIARFAHADRIVVPGMSKVQRNAAEIALGGLESGQRISVVTLSDLQDLPDDARVTFVSPSWDFEELVTLRVRARRHHNPVTAIIHSLCSPDVLRGVLQIAISPVRQYDALVCPSMSAKKALDNMLDSVRSAMAQAEMGSIGRNVETAVIRHGVSLEPFAQRCADAGRDVTVLYLGRFSDASKGDLRPLLLAWRETCSRDSGSKLVLAGDDTQSMLTPDLWTLARALGCHETINIVPNPSSAVKKSLLQSADIFVSPSDNLQESFGFTLLEAMAAGLPIVASDWSGYRDIVRHGINGFLIESIFPCHSDCVTEYAGLLRSEPFAACTAIDLRGLVAALSVLIGDRERRIAMGLQSRRMAEELFSWQTVIGCYEDLWSELHRRAADAPCRHTPFDLDVWQPSRFFGHYASRLWADTMIVSRRGDDEPTAELLKHQLAIGGLSPQSLPSIWETLSAGSLTVSQICEKAHIDRARVCMSLGRLAKFGLIDVHARPVGVSGCEPQIGGGP
jgi:glycosyltransferase involved in cell wall biosynthesis